MSEADAEFVDRLVERVRGGNIGYVLVVSSREEQTRLFSLARRGAESADTIATLKTEASNLRGTVRLYKERAEALTAEVEDAHRREACAADLAREWEQHCKTAEAEITRLRALAPKENTNVEA
jgi:predicted RNase H-like nuclease (RuvC/YqgF family)